MRLSPVLCASHYVAVSLFHFAWPLAGQKNNRKNYLFIRCFFFATITTNWTSPTGKGRSGIDNVGIILYRTLSNSLPPRQDRADSIEPPPRVGASVETVYISEQFLAAVAALRGPGMLDRFVSIELPPLVLLHSAPCGKRPARTRAFQYVPSVVCFRSRGAALIPAGGVGGDSLCLAGGSHVGRGRRARHSA